MPDFEQVQSSEKKLEFDISKKYSFLASRMDRLKQPVHYEESHLKHMVNCRNELQQMNGEFNDLSSDPAERQKLIEIVGKALDLHEISKLIKPGEVEGLDDPLKHDVSNEERSGQLIKLKSQEFGISSQSEAELISFLVSNYHTLNQLFKNEIRPEEIANKLKEFSAGKDLEPKKILELLRILSNANNLSAVEVKNSNENKKYNREDVKNAIDYTTDEVRKLL